MVGVRQDALRATLKTTELRRLLTAGGDDFFVKLTAQTYGRSSPNMTRAHSDVNPCKESLLGTLHHPPWTLDPEAIQGYPET